MPRPLALDNATYVANQVGVAERQRLAKREYDARRNVLKKAERALEGRARKIPPIINTNTTASAVECASSLLLQLSAPRALPIAPTISAASPHIVQTRTIFTNATQIDLISPTLITVNSPTTTSTTTTTCTSSTTYTANITTVPVQSARRKRKKSRDTQYSHPRQNDSRTRRGCVKVMTYACVVAGTLTAVPAIALPASAIALVFFAMHFKGSCFSTDNDSDTIRVKSTLELCTATHFVTVSKEELSSGSHVGVGHFCSNFKEKFLLEQGSFSGAIWIGMFDYNFPQVDGGYFDQWHGHNFVFKCANVISRGMRIFIMPSFRSLHPGAHGGEVVRGWMTKEWAGTKVLFPNVGVFSISSADAERLHPLVVGTMHVADKLSTRGRGKTKNESAWASQKDKIGTDIAFYVFYSACAGETDDVGEKRVRSELKTHTPRPQ
jgi:hypothetical protein